MATCYPSAEKQPVTTAEDFRATQPQGEIPTSFWEPDQVGNQELAGQSRLLNGVEGPKVISYKGGRKLTEKGSLQPGIWGWCRPKRPAIRKREDWRKACRAPENKGGRNCRIKKKKEDPLSVTRPVAPGEEHSTKEKVRTPQSRKGERQPDEPVSIQSRSS